MNKRVLIATGGTGGHIYPAMALAQQFASKNKHAKVLFAGGKLDVNPYFDRESFDYCTIACGAFIGKSPLAWARSCLSISNGIRQSCKIIEEFKPDVVVGFGSYYSFPPLIAAKWKSIPIILHEANSIPGKVNKILAPFAFATGVHFPKTKALLKGSVHEVGMPLRQGFEKNHIDKMQALNYFGLLSSSNEKVILIFGGSQGANVINQQFLTALNLIKNKPSLSVIHITGASKHKETLVDAYAKLGIPACVKEFEDHMHYAWQAADLAITRSGASSIAEQLEFEVPGILIPFARAADDHQNHNADFLVDTVRGAIKIEEKNLTPEKLAVELSKIFEEKNNLDSNLHGYLLMK